MTAKKRRSLSLVIVLIAILIVGATYAFFTDNEAVVNEFTVGDLDIELTEPSWKPEEGEEIPPGRVVEKDPTVTELEGDSYMRMVVSYVDMTDFVELDRADYATEEAYKKARDAAIAAHMADASNLITAANRIALIEQTIYFDKTGVLAAGVTGDMDTDRMYVLDENDDLFGKGISRLHNRSLNQLVTADSIDRLYNEALFATTTGPDSASGVKYYKYIGNQTSAAGGAGVLKKGESATLFTHIVIPAEWNQTQTELLGKYAVVIKAEAIQTEGFVDSADAFKALDIELAR